MSIQEPFAKAAVSVSIIFLSYVMLLLLSLLFSFMLGMRPTEIQGDSLAYDPVPFLTVGTLPMVLALIVIPLLFEMKTGNRNAASFGLTSLGHQSILKWFTYTLSAGVIIFVAAGNFPAAIPVLLHYIVSCFGEELLFRGILQKRLSENMNAYIAIVISSLIFALGFHQSGIFIDNILIRFPLSFIFGFLFFKTKSIYPSFALHLAYNMFVSF